MRRPLNQHFIPFNKAFIAGRELDYIASAVSQGELKGDGPFTRRCQEWLEERFETRKALLTHSCTGALEMAGQLLDVRPGDEVILPSFTFTSTANAFILAGAKPVFAEIRPDTLNIDEKCISTLVTHRTRAICVVHYAGMACEMDAIMQVARSHNLAVVEDAAHGILSTYKGRSLGTIGEIGALSFHETKNFSAGEGGAILLNRSSLIDRAEMIREKGTDRSRFFRGEVDKYTWMDTGGSYLPSELIAAFLYGQLERAAEIQKRRMSIWESYYSSFESLERAGLVRRPIIPADCTHNAHLFYLLLESSEAQQQFIGHLRSQGIGAVFHYQPLHSAPMAKRFGYQNEDLPITEDIAGRLVRLPIFCDLGPEDLDRIITAVFSFFQPAWQSSFVSNL